MMYFFVLLVMNAIAKLFYHHKIYGVENVCSGASIIAPNHTSFLDPPIIAISAPEKIYFLARRTLFKGLFGKFIYSLNSRPVSGDGSNITVFREIGALLNEGKHIVLFPEGTRSRDGKLKEVKPGIFFLFNRTHCVVQPTYIGGAYEIWRSSSKWPKLTGKTVCVFGKPLRWEAYEHLEKRAAQAKFAEDLKNAILALKAWYENGAKGEIP